VEEGQLVKVESLIRSMTPAERKRPQLIDRSRASRIARGSGRKQSEVHELLERFGQMREMMGALGRGGMLGRLAGAGGADPLSVLGSGQGGGLPGMRARARKADRQKDKRKQARKARRRNRRR
jgi:signal recognition particle subunit SRP54